MRRTSTRFQLGAVATCQLRSTVMYTLIQTAKLNDVDPQAWLADTLSKIADTPQSRLSELLPWKMDDCSATDVLRPRV
jgi:hypothetical protein